MTHNLSYAKGLVDCRIDIDQALAFLGHTDQVINEDLHRRLLEMAARCEREHTPRFLWKTLEIEECADGGPIGLKGSTLTLPGASIRAHLHKATRVTLLAVTIGRAWDTTMRALSATSSVDALLYNACANALTESAAESAHALVAQAANENGLVAHARFSPGYGDLPLDIHPDFLAEIDATRKIGITATESNFLEPAKSITALIGLFENDAQSDDSTVQLCTTCAARTYCNFRERGTTCH